MDMQLLKQLYAIHAPTGNEWSMIQFVREYVKCHIPEATLLMDRLGNLYIKKGEDGHTGYPTLACHLDQVQALHSSDFEVRQEGNMLYGWSEQNQRREGLGADDKNGIFIALRCLEQCPRLKVFMAVGEEKGCIGSNHAHMPFFSDSLYVLEPDCKGGTEPHTVLKGIRCGSTDFEEALRTEAHGFTITEGKGSDILALTLNNIGVSCVNLPAGYHLPHKDEEYTSISELQHTLDFTLWITNSLRQRFPHTYMSETQQRIALMNQDELY